MHRPSLQADTSPTTSIRSTSRKTGDAAWPMRMEQCGLRAGRWSRFACCCRCHCCLSPQCCRWLLLMGLSGLWAGPCLVGLLGAAAVAVVVCDCMHGGVIWLLLLGRAGRLQAGRCLVSTAGATAAAASVCVHRRGDSARLLPLGQSRLWV